MQRSQVRHTHFCWICGYAVDLETCKTDEYGMAVHENCYVIKLVLTNESMRLIMRAPPAARPERCGISKHPQEKSDLLD